MKDAFKVKKGLNIQPTDPADVVNPEAGDIIVDSTDDNRLKVYDPTSSEFAAVGTGGSSGNILSDIEKLTPTVSNVVAVTDTTTFLPIDDNNKSVKATFSGSDGSIRYEGPASADLDGVQGVVKVWIKTDVEGLSLVATKDGVAQNNGLTVNSSNKWRQYEIPVVLGDADYGFEIQASGAVSGDVYIDEAFVKVEAVIRDLGAAHFFAKVVIPRTGNINCKWFDGVSTGNQLPQSDPDCGDAANGEITGNITMNDTKVPRFILRNLKAGNRYRVDVSNLIYKNGTSSNASCSMSASFDGGATFIGVRNIYRSTSGITGNIVTNFFDTASFSFEAQQSGDQALDFYIAESVLDNCQIDTRLQEFRVEIYAYPDSSSTIVTQDTELTAKTANEFSAEITSTGVVISENYDWIASTSQAANQTTLNFSSDVFTVAPVCVATYKDNASAGDIRIHDVSSSSVIVAFNAAGSDAGILQNFTIHCSKQGADVNKSATIVGKFENINSSDLCALEARGASSAVSIIPGAPIPFTEVSDNCNAWNGSQYTAPKSGWYKVNGSVRASASVLQYMDSRINNVDKNLVFASTPANSYLPFSDLVYLNAGDVYHIRSESTFTTVTGDARTHWISLQQLPDTEAIVKNLSNQKVEYQTKSLTADATGTGLISELQFNNLEVGKTYRINAEFYIYDSNTAAGYKGAQIEIFNGATRIFYLQRDVGLNTSIIIDARDDLSKSKIFKATDTTITVNVTSLLGGSLVRSGANRSFVELEELPDTYVETSKF